ncbi:MAG: sigma-70 family RNA polymerase sigma factor [Acidimicrobiia bacterium]|nr:sigma-70 family RNA polymerase sigma factor [Acidimicrobiia bacterium]
MVEAATAIRFRKLYDQHHRAVLAYFLRRLDSDAAYEATEDVFLVAWRRLDTVPDGERALAWLYSVARRVLANHRRSRARRRRLWNRLADETATVGPGPEAVVVRREEHEELLTALARLPDKDQELLRLAVWEELPHADIGDLLGCSVGAVDVRLHRAVRRLEKGLRQAGHRPGRRPAFLPGEES